MTLPPLPPFAAQWTPRWIYDVGGFTAEQMREYAHAAVLAEREACAVLCDTRGADHRHDYKHGGPDIGYRPISDHSSDEAGSCADAIRARGGSDGRR